MVAPKNPSETPPVQGELFVESVTRNGDTDIDTAKEVVSYDIVPGQGVFPEAQTEQPTAPTEVAPDDAAMAITRATHNAATQRRGNGQKGLHSPLKRDGTYLAVRVGDYLPGFGPVKDSNFDKALRHAEYLEKNRSTRPRHKT